MTRRAGFTLLEMLLTLSITALLAVITLSKFNPRQSGNLNLHASLTTHLYELQWSAMQDPSLRYQIYVNNEEHYYQFQSYPLSKNHELKSGAASVLHTSPSKTFKFDSNQSIRLHQNLSQTNFLIAFDVNGNPSEDIENCKANCLKIDTHDICINHLGRIYACNLER